MRSDMRRVVGDVPSRRAGASAVSALWGSPPLAGSPPPRGSPPLAGSPPHGGSRWVSRIDVVVGSPPRGRLLLGGCLCIDMCVDMCVDMCIDVGVGMCVGVCVDMSIHMCIDRGIGMCKSMCTSHVHGHVHRH